MKKLLSVLLTIALLTGCGLAAMAEEAQDPAEVGAFETALAASFGDPDMEFWPEARWWLAEGSHTDATIEEAVQQAYDSGLGALEFATLEAGVDAQTYSWGSEEWINDSHRVIEAASALGMGASFTSGPVRTTG